MRVFVPALAPAQPGPWLPCPASITVPGSSSRPSNLCVGFSCRAPVSLTAAILVLDAELQACAFSPEAQCKVPTTPNANRILEEDVDEEGQLVPAAGAEDPSAAFSGLLNEGNLYLLADRSKVQSVHPPSQPGHLPRALCTFCTPSSGFNSLPFLPRPRQGREAGPGLRLCAAADGGWVRRHLPDGRRLGKQGGCVQAHGRGASGHELPTRHDSFQDRRRSEEGTRVGEGAFREVAAFLLDRPPAAAKATPLSGEEAVGPGFSGVPLTLLARCDDDVFPAQGAPATAAATSMISSPPWLTRCRRPPSSGPCSSL